MDENILLYQVKPGDTLDKIGGTIGMTGNQLKDFHNAHCGKMERLWFNNLVGIKQIIIPKEYKSPEQIRKEKETALPPSSITREFYATGYTVKESFSDGSGNSLEIEYKIDVSFKKKQDLDGPGEIVDVKCYDFKKNGTTPDDKISEISLACMESIYPIPFMISFSGRICGIFEFEKLKQRFQEKRPDLDAFFIGEVYQAYLNKFQAVLDKQEYMLKQFSSVLLYQTLFPQMECFRKTGNWTQEFCLLQNSFPVKCLINAEYNHDDPEFVQTLLSGQIDDTFSLQEILSGKSTRDPSQNPAGGQIAFRYITDKKTKTLNHADASVKFMNDDELNRQQTLKLSRNE